MPANIDARVRSPGQESIERRPAGRQTIMNDLPEHISEDPRDMDTGELFRPDPRHLTVPARKKTPREIAIVVGIAGAAIAAALFALTR